MLLGRGCDPVRLGESKEVWKFGLRIQPVASLVAKPVRRVSPQGLLAVPIIYVSERRKKKHRLSRLSL